VVKVELYTTMFCPYCARARNLLQKKGVPFSDIDVMTDDERRQEMIARAGGRHTVPQIFIDGRHIGGSDELAALDLEGKLDPLLGLAG
jgi:glutaredoxin 3